MRYSIPLTAMRDMFLGQVKSVHVPLSRGTASKALKWALIIFTGSSLIDVTRGWTYHYSQEVMNWTQTRQWCQTHYTDMVAIQSQEENDYLVSILPNRTRSPYYWIGITRTHANETWTWVGHNSTWIGSKSWAQDEPNNDHTTEFCVEIYINYGANRGRWNDEKCANKKYPVCYQAQCTNASCERGKCTETINKTRCDCEPGFEGDRCQAAVACKEPIKPLYGDMRCSGRHGDHNFESTCSFLCEEGFMLSGPSVLSCNSSGLWDDKEPQCIVVECSALSGPDDGYINCSGSNQTFNSTCRFGCSMGFLLLGSTEVTCGSDGRWKGPRPFCASYKHALMALAGCVACSALCCLCFCCSKYRKRKKRTQLREPEEATIPANGTYN